MVMTGIIGIILFLLEPVVSLLPTVDVSGLGSGAQAFLPWVKLAAYMLPMGTFVAIFKIILALMIFRIVIAFFKSLWGVIPIL